LEFSVVAAFAHGLYADKAASHTTIDFMQQAAKIEADNSALYRQMQAF